MFSHFDSAQERRPDRRLQEHSLLYAERALPGTKIKHFNARPNEVISNL